MRLRMSRIFFFLNKDGSLKKKKKHHKFLFFWLTRQAAKKASATLGQLSEWRVLFPTRSRAHYGLPTTFFHNMQQKASSAGGLRQRVAVVMIKTEPEGVGV